jgi:hypothetical protein
MTPKPTDEQGKPNQPNPPAPPPHPPGTKKPETTPAEERGERIDTGKAIARGGKTEGEVPGGEPGE